MKSVTKKYFLGLSLVTALVLGIFLSKPILLQINQLMSKNSSIAYYSQTGYMGGNITTHTQNAKAIIIGEVILALR